MQRILLLFFCCSFLISNAQEAKFEADLRFLASDEMRGRANGSPEIEAAAAYIVDEFKKMGLSSPSFCENYLQEIQLIRSNKELSRSLIINGETIANDDFFVMSQIKELHKVDTLGLKMVYVGEQDDIMAAFNVLSNYASSYAVIIHPVHQKRFERLKPYFSNQVNQVKKDNPNFSLWLKSDLKEVSSLNLHVRSEYEILSIYNVVGELKGKVSPDKYWAFSGHYDHIGIRPEVEGDSIANGADDDASGVVAMMELARKWSAADNNDKSLLFIAFAGEELGLYGSKFMATELNTPFEAMVNIEMIGNANEDLGPQAAYVTGFEYSHWPKDIVANSRDEFMFFPDPYPELDLFLRSDNAPFVGLGIAAHSISTYSKSNPHYHKVSDEIDTIDFEHMEEVIDAIYKGIEPFIKDSYNPGIIDYKTK